MRISLAGVGLVTATLGAAIAFAACADAEDPAVDALGEVDGSAVPAPDASEPVDAAGDGGLTDADAEPRTCTDASFCHTIVPAGHTLRGVWGDGAGVVWAVSEEGDVLRWDGATWKIHASSLGKLEAIWGSGPTDVWIGGDRGLFHGTGPSPDALAFAPSGPALGVTSIWGLGPSDAWAVGTVETDGGGVVSRVLRLSGGDGGTWAVDAVSSQKLLFRRVWGTAASGVWLAGTRPIPDEPGDEVVVLRRRAPATTFTAMALPNDPEDPSAYGKLSVLHAVTATSDTSIVLHGETLGALRVFLRATSANAGLTFTWTIDALPRAEEPKLRALAAFAADDVWAAGDYGRLRHWDGTAWGPQAPIATGQLPVISPFHAMWARTPNELWVVGKDIALRGTP